LDPPYFENGEARNFKFGMQIRHWGPNEKCKIKSKGVDGVT